MTSLPAYDEQPSKSLRDRKKERTRRVIQAEALRLFAEKGFEATTIEEIAGAADVAARTFFRYFSTKEEVVFWPVYRPLLGGFMAARQDESAVAALCHAIVEGLSAFYDEDRERVLERLKLAFRTPALHPRLRQEQATSARAMAEVLAERLGRSADELEIRAIAAAVAAALWVAVEEWQATDGQAELGPLIERALGTVLTGSIPSRDVTRKEHGGM